jgi:hypothetical protein
VRGLNQSPSNASWVERTLRLTTVELVARGDGTHRADSQIWWRRRASVQAPSCFSSELLLHTFLLLSQHRVQSRHDHHMIILLWVWHLPSSNKRYHGGHPCHLPSRQEQSGVCPHSPHPMGLPESSEKPPPATSAWALLLAILWLPFPRWTRLGGIYMIQTPKEVASCMQP